MRNSRRGNLLPYGIAPTFLRPHEGGSIVTGLLRHFAPHNDYFAVFTAVVSVDISLGY